MSDWDDDESEVIPSPRSSKKTTTTTTTTKTSLNGFADFKAKNKENADPNRRTDKKGYKSLEEGETDSEPEPTPTRKKREAEIPAPKVPPFDFRNQSKTPDPAKLERKQKNIEKAENRRNESMMGDSDGSWNLDSDAAEATLAAIRGNDNNQQNSNKKFSPRDGRGDDRTAKSPKSSSRRDRPKSPGAGDHRAKSPGTKSDRAKSPRSDRAKSPRSDRAKSPRSDRAKSPRSGRAKSPIPSASRSSSAPGNRFPSAFNNRSASAKTNFNNNSPSAPADRSTSAPADRSKTPTGASPRGSKPPSDFFSNFTVEVSEEETSDDNDEDDDEDDGVAKSKTGAVDKKRRRRLSTQLGRAAKSRAASAKASIKKVFKSGSRGGGGGGGDGEELEVQEEKRGEEEEEEEKTKERESRRNSSASLVSSLSTPMPLVKNPAEMAPLSDPVVQTFHLETRHALPFLAAPDTDFGARGVHEFAARGERRIRHLTHAAFGVVRVVLVFPAVLLLAIVQSAWRYVAQPVVFGVVEIAVDTVATPLAALLFNKIVSPTASLTFNALTALRSTLRPAFGILEDAAGVLARVLGSIRLVNVERRSGVSGDREGRLQEV